MELTKTKLNNILKKYRAKLEQHEKEWVEICKKARLKTGLPTIYEHESYNSKGNQLFKALINEFEGYNVFERGEKIKVSSHKSIQQGAN